MSPSGAGADDAAAEPEVRPTVVMICVNRRFRMDEPSCAARGSEDLANRLEAEITERGIDVKVERSVCMGHCQTGPTVRLAPSGRFYHGPSADEVPGILDELERLCGRKADDPDAPPMHLLGS